MKHYNKYEGYNDHQQQQQQKHHTAIISMQVKQNLKKIAAKKHKKSTYLDPELRQYILQNGSLIMNFLQQKLSIVKLSDLNTKGQLIMNNCSNQGYQDKFKQIKQSLYLLQTECIHKFSIDQTKAKDQRYMNELIYQFLAKINQINLFIQQSFQSINTIFNQQLSQESIQLHRQRQSRFSSPHIQKNLLEKSQHQSTTNHLSRGKSRIGKTVQKFTQDFIHEKSNYCLESPDNNNKIGTFSQNQENDSLDMISHEQQQPFHRIKTELEHFQNLQNYYLSFLISYAAFYQQQYSQFIQSLFKQIEFPDQYNPQMKKQIENSFINDNQYALEIIIQGIRNKFDRILNHDSSINISQNKFIYFPDQQNFLKLTHIFIAENLNQQIQKIKQFCEKVERISEIFTQIKHVEGIENIQSQEYDQRQAHMTDTLSNYLPKQNQYGSYKSLNQITFSQKALNNLKSNMLQSFRAQTNKYTFAASMNIFQQIIMRICLYRIFNCKRLNLDATASIFQILNQSNYVNKLKQDSFNETKKYSRQIELLQAKFQKINQKLCSKKLKKIFNEWKKIKLRKLKLLKVLIKKKMKYSEKQKLLAFNIWRINISRQIVQQKMLAHSYSCSSVINHFAQKQIGKIQSKKLKTIEKIHLKSRQKEINSMSEISLKRQSSFKSFSKSRNLNQSSVNTTKNRFAQSRIPQKSSQQLLNYRYKEEILSRINKVKNSAKFSYKNGISSTITVKN